MIKIVALNEDTEDDKPDIVTQEAQESLAESEFIRALKLKSHGEIDLCLNLLQELLETQVLNENLKNNPNAKLSIVKYNCHKNIAMILEERFEYLTALQHYISAILIDSSDVSTLYRFGKLALKVNATDLAEYAFENCLKRNSKHWCAAEGLLEVMNMNHNIIGSYRCARKLYEQNENCGKAGETLKEIQFLFRQNLWFLQNCSESE